MDIDFSQEKEEFERYSLKTFQVAAYSDPPNSILAKAVRTLVQGLEGKLAPALVSMTKMPWNTWESVGDQVAYMVPLWSGVSSYN